MARALRVIRIFRVDARRTALLVVVPALALLGVLAGWRALVPGMTSWDNAVVALNSSVRLLSPVAAGLAAWAGVRGHQLEYLRALAARSPVTGPLHDLALIVSVALAAYGLVALVIIGQAAWQPDAGRPYPLAVLAGAAALALQVTFGYLTGRQMPHPAVPPTVAAFTLISTAFRPSGSWLNLLPPASFGPVGPFEALRPGIFMAQLLWAVGIGAAMVLGYAAFASGRHRLLVGVAAALAVTVVCTVRLHSYGGMATGPAPMAYTCREWPVTVCVHPTLRDALPALGAAIAPLAARLASTGGALTRAEQHPEAGRSSDGTARFRLTEISPGFAQQAARDVRDGLVDPEACARNTRGAAYNLLVNAWLLDEPQPKIPDQAAALRFGGWDEAERRAWLTLRFTAYRHCRLGPADFR